VETDSAFERFYMSEAKAVFTAVYMMCRDKELAEDATQEAFARALERWDRLEPHTWAAGCRGWLVPREARNPDEAVDLWTAVRGLPRRQQEAVVLYYRLGVPVQEIAQVLGCGNGTVRTHLARAREALRTVLEEGPDGD